MLGKAPLGCSWPVVRLLDVVSLPSGQVDPKVLPYREWPLIAPDHVESDTGAIKEVVSAAAQAAISGKYVFAHGDVLYSKIRPYLRKAVLASFSGLCSADMYPMKPGPDILPSMLLAVLLGEEFTRFAVAVSMRSGIPKINREELQEFSFALPPLPEQRRIAEILDTADEAIRRSEALLVKLEQVKAGLLHDLLTRGLDEAGRLRDPEAHPEQFQDSPLGRIPREWRIGPLVERVDFPQGQVDPRIESYRSLLLVAPDHVESGTGRLLSLSTAEFQDAISGKYAFEATDVLYSKIRPHLRKAAWPQMSGLCSADIYPLRPHPCLHPAFLLATLLGEHFSRFAEAVSMRSGFPKINRDELATYVCAWPPLPEQRRIAAILDGHDARIRAERAQLDKLRQIKKGLMHDLLTGKVRVQVHQEARHP